MCAMYVMCAWKCSTEQNLHVNPPELFCDWQPIRKAAMFHGRVRSLLLCQPPPHCSVGEKAAQTEGWDSFNYATDYEAGQYSTSTHRLQLTAKWVQVTLHQSPRRKFKLCQPEWHQSVKCYHDMKPPVSQRWAWWDVLAVAVAFMLCWNSSSKKMNTHCLFSYSPPRPAFQSLLNVDLTYYRSDSYDTHKCVFSAMVKIQCLHK